MATLPGSIPPLPAVLPLPLVTVTVMPFWLVELPPVDESTQDGHMTEGRVIEVRLPAVMRSICVSLSGIAAMALPILKGSIARVIISLGILLSSTRRIAGPIRNAATWLLSELLPFTSSIISDVRIGTSKAVFFRQCNDQVGVSKPGSLR